MQIDFIRCYIDYIEATFGYSEYAPGIWNWLTYSLVICEIYQLSHAVVVGVDDHQMH